MPPVLPCAPSVAGELRPVVLVVEEREFATFLRHALASHNIVAMTAETGQEAIELASQISVHIALLGSGLPDMDVRELLSTLRSASPGLLACLLIEGKVRRDKLPHRGVRHVFEKPFSVTELAQAILELKQEFPNRWAGAPAAK